MFIFGTTSYINGTTYGADASEKRFEANKDKGLFIVRHNHVKIAADQIVNTEKGNQICKKVGCIGKPDTVEIDLSSCTSTSETYRLSLYVGLSMADQDSYYANDFIFRGKGFQVEFPGAGDDTAKNLVDLIEKMELLMIEKKVLNVSYSGNKLTITGKTAYQRFKKILVEEYKETVQDVTPGVTGGFEVILDKTADVVKGHDEFGTYFQLTKDNYLPTYEHRVWNAVQGDEDPIPGAIYTQYLVNICVKRGIMGGDAVGEVSHSQTTHVFWVKSDVCSDFESELKNAGITKIEVVDPHGEEDTHREATHTVTTEMSAAEA